MTDILTPDERLTGHPFPRCPCIIVIDRSSDSWVVSQSEIASGISAMWRQLSRADFASKVADVAVLEFNSQNFFYFDNFRRGENLEKSRPLQFLASGLDEVLNFAVSAVDKRKKIYEENFVQSSRPWIFLISSGLSIDKIQKAQIFIPDGEIAMKFSFFATGFSESDTNTLEVLSTCRKPLILKQGHINDLFVWLARALEVVSESIVPGDHNTCLPEIAWAEK